MIGERLGIKLADVQRRHRDETLIERRLRCAPEVVRASAIQRNGDRRNALERIATASA